MRRQRLSRRRWMQQTASMGLLAEVASSAPELSLELGHRDYFQQALSFSWPRGFQAETAQARVSIVQPYGFQQQLETTARRSGQRGELVILYPLVDEGRYAPLPSEPKDWGMGSYRFEVTLKSDGQVLGRGTKELDPNEFFGEIGGQKLAQVDSLRQFIECSPLRPAFIDETRVGFTIRTIQERVKNCVVEVDVVRPGEGQRLAGPLRLDLDGRVQRHSFDGEAWPRGEYWLRVRVQQRGRAVGPYLVRQFFMETPHRPPRPQNPLRIAQVPQYLLDGWIFDSSSGLKFAPDQLEIVSDGPIAELDRPWEQGPDRIRLESFWYDQEARQFRATYYAGPLTEDERLWKMGVRSTLTSVTVRYLCLTVSSDGVHWEKPELGLVDYQGSRRNNILRDRSKEGFLLSGEFDSFPLPVKERPLPSKYRYRFYDPERDGPVEMDNFVFRVFLRASMEPDEQFLGSFRPRHREFWGFERRGDLFLALTPKPVLTGARGMHLIHTNERASTYPFEGDSFSLFQPQGRSTSTYYHRPSKTFFYYFRPDSPAYPPNGLPYYLWHRVAAIRTRAVVWTRDGIHWQRRHMLVPDEHDPPGTTLYGFGFLKPAGREVSDTDGQLFLGAVLRWDLAQQRIHQHLIWSRDLIHWSQFGANRKPLLEGDPVGSWNTSWGGLANYQAVVNADGEEEWFFPFWGKNARYMLGGYLTADTLEEFKKKFPYFQLAPFFTSWEDFYRETRRHVVLPGLSRCKAGRLAHVEPDASKGEFTTLPLVVEGTRLVLNGQTDPGGSIRVEVQDAEGNPFPELRLEDCVPFSGDRVGHVVRWKRARLEEVNRRVVRLRVVVKEARLYAFRIAG